MENIQKENWNKFILENGGSFLHSFEWGEFQAAVGRQVFRFATDKWQTQFIEMPLPFGKKYWHCPRGPVIINDKEQLAGDQVKKIIETVKKKVGDDVIFFRLGPEWDINHSYWPMANSLKEMGFKQLPYDIEPSQTLVLDITKTENELLAQMHEKWRYNIQLAKRKGVIVKNYQYSPAVTSEAGQTIFEAQFEKFYKLVDKGTSDRKKIKHHSKEYYKKQLEIDGESVKFRLFLAEYDGEAIAANIVVICGKRATYLHGATGSEHREVMAPHLLQWEQIEYAKSLGCTKYDFWGIVNEHTLDKRGKSWEGFTRFKKGFGGYEINYVGYFDYPLSMIWHLLYRLVQKFRR